MSTSKTSLNGCKTKGENPKREKWDKSHEFVFTVAGGAIGLGNVWRFPYLCYSNGGGSFVVAYLFFLFLVAVPVILMEVTMGQFMSRGGIEVWNIVPIAKGIGFAQLIVIIYLNIYYIVILAWTLHYFFESVVAFIKGSSVPWSACGEWTSECCSTNYTETNGTSILVRPLTCVSNPIIPEAEYFSNKMLQITPGILDFGGINWPILGYFILSWIIVTLVILRGIKSTGKVAYVTSTFPMLLLAILVLRGLTLEGAKEGIIFYLKPNWEYLKQSKTWTAAGSQLIFSTVIFVGSHSSLGSYNKWSFNSIKWSARLAFMNSLASLFAGFAIFSILGHLSVTTNLPIDQVADKGPGLAFIAYPRALTKLGNTPIWSMVFFLMLFVLGVASECATAESLITSLVDLSPSYLKSSIPGRRQIFVVAVCFICFIAGLPMILKSGIYFFNLMDTYGCTGVALMLSGLCEVLAIAWIYGTDRYFENLKDMCYTSRADRGKHMKSDPYKFPWFILRYLWQYVTPAVLLIAFAYNVFTISSPEYISVVTGSYKYPTFGVCIAIFLVVSSISAIPIYIFYVLVTRKLDGKTISWEDLTSPIYDDDHPYAVRCEKDDMVKTTVNLRSM